MEIFEGSSIFQPSYSSLDLLHALFLEENLPFLVLGVGVSGSGSGLSNLQVSREEDTESDDDDLGGSSSGFHSALLFPYNMLCLPRWGGFSTLR